MRLTHALIRKAGLAGPGGCVAAIDGGLRARLENKADFDHLLRQAGVPQEVRIPTIRVDGVLPSLGELRRRLATAGWWCRPGPIPAVAAAST
jgi:hypothetical protein